VLRVIWLRGAEQERMALAFVPALLFVIAAKFERLFPQAPFPSWSSEIP
jgi:hypothetical protein